MVILAGQCATGASVSLTVTLKLHEAVLPLASVTVQVTVPLPLAKVEPLAGAQLTVWPGQLSAPVGVMKLTTALHIPGSVDWVMSAGQTIVGGCASLTVTVKLQVPVLPDVSVAVQLTVLVPTGKVAPEAGLQAIVEPEQLSVAVAA